MTSPNDRAAATGPQRAVGRPPYETPRIQLMDEEEVVESFQRRPLEVGVVGCGGSRSWPG